MIYDNFQEIAIMWSSHGIIKKGLHKTNFNVKKNINIEKGDKVYIGKTKTNNKRYWLVEEVKSVKQSTLTHYNYTETMCSYIII